MDGVRQAAVEVAKRGYSLAMQTGGTPWQAAICAAIDAYERAMWRPVAEAPRDGTRVLMYAPAAGGEYPTSIQRIDRWRDGGWRQMRPAQPYTHFRHLSAGPNADGR